MTMFYFLEILVEQVGAARITLLKTMGMQRRVATPLSRQASQFIFLAYQYLERKSRDVKKIEGEIILRVLGSIQEIWKG